MEETDGEGSASAPRSPSDEAESHMAETITIPSPSVFLRASPPPYPAASPNPTPTKHVRRSSSAEARKKAPRKSLAPLTGLDGSPVKPKQSKSRNGCHTCKAKRLKCGEEKPGCQNCARRKVECGGYKRDFKWRTFEEQNVKVDRQQRGNSPNQASANSSKRTSPNRDHASVPATDAAVRPLTAAGAKKDSIVEDASGSTTLRLPQRTRPAKGKRRATERDSRPVSPVDNLPPLDLSSLTSDVGISSLEYDLAISHDQLQPGSLSHLTPGLGLSPNVTDMLLPFNMDDPMHQDFVQFNLPEGFQIPNMHGAMIDPNLLNGDVDDDGMNEFVNSADLIQGLPSMPGTGQNTPMSAISPARSPLDVFGQHTNYIYPQPYFADDSREMLTLRYDKLTCGILSIMDGPNENPWRTLIWPLAQQSPALYHAISAMTAFHSMQDVPHFRVVGGEHKAWSIHYIQEGIRDNSFTIQTAIATALVLGYAEAWDTHTTTGNSHIKGAQALVRRAIQDHRQSPVRGVELARLKFLCNAWVYMDVIARLTSVDSDESNDFDNTFIFSGNPREAPPMIMGNVDRGFGIDFGMPIDARLDPRMGCAVTLFPLIGRVANLVRRVCRSLTNSPAVISQANELKMSLERWQLPTYIEEPEDPMTEGTHAMQTAHAYKWATLLHLHQAVPELPSLPTAELAQRVLRYMATVPLGSRAIGVHIYPMMVGGCEAVTQEDRDWVRGRWQAMEQRMRVGTIAKCALVTEEVWRRRDAFEAEPSSNRRLVATAELCPAPNRRQPLLRTPTGSTRLGEPGRTGMVFSYVEGEDQESPERPSSTPAAVTFGNKDARPAAEERHLGMRDINVACTVRGHIHWIGVMWAWGWEILLG